ncbi:hypothetical protein [Floridanema aerugineum]|uniref:Uncharacterized protein n=1 Tax=Floridaenema aerugineum BLCC-F46 TaxID=3153654 RepID=A0ABV4XFK6_9CYAN
MQDRPINEGSNTEAQAVINQPRYTAFRSLDTLFTRGETVFKMVRDFSQCAVRDLPTAVLRDLSNINKVSVMDIYDRPAREAFALLLSRGIKAEEKKVSEQEACSLKNLQKTQWTLNPNQAVVVLTYNDRVVGVHPSSNNDNPPVS